MNAHKLLKGLVLAGSMICGTAALAHQVVPDLPEYTPVSGISGNLMSFGSDTLNNLMTLWSEDFNNFYPNVNFQIQGAGTSTAPPALAEGTANFGRILGVRFEQLTFFAAQFDRAYTRSVVTDTGVANTVDGLGNALHH